MNEKIITSGKRKRAVARAMLIPNGTGEIEINSQKMANLHLFDKLKIEEVMRISESTLGKRNFDVKIRVDGGGEKGQIEAARIALAKAILKFSGQMEELEKVFLAYDRNMIVADIRRKESYKPGDSKARAKRQKSFR